MPPYGPTNASSVADVSGPTDVLAGAPTVSAGVSVAGVIPVGAAAALVMLLVTLRERGSSTAAAAEAADALVTPLVTL